MSNLKINDTITKIVNYSPVVLFTVMFLIFGVTGYLQHEYYLNIYDGILEDTMYVAFLFPLIIQTLRLVTGFLSSSFFQKGRYLLGVLVFAFSLWLTLFEHNEAANMGQFWTTIEIDISTATQIEDSKILLVQDSITIMIRILIWSALGLEFFLAFWLTMTSKKQNKKDDNYVIIEKEKKSKNGAVSSVK